jgi:hypothetical protein
MKPSIRAWIVAACVAVGVALSLLALSTYLRYDGFMAHLHLWWY